MRRYGYTRVRWVNLPGEPPAGKTPLGSWLEKREAFMLMLQRSGEILKHRDDVDILFVEHFSSWERIKRRGWHKSAHSTLWHELLATATCPIIYILDDPELACDFAYGHATEVWCAADSAGDVSREKSAEVGRGQQDRVIWGEKTVPFYFHTLLPRDPLRIEHNGRGVYMGKGEGGRSADIVDAQRRSGVPPLDVYGRPQDFSKDVRDVLPPPALGTRRATYAEYGAGLGLQDRDHRRYGFATGRIWHAFCAGTISLSADEYIARGREYMSNPALRAARYAEMEATFERQREVTMAVLRRWGLV